MTRRPELAVRQSRAGKDVRRGHCWDLFIISFSFLVWGETCRLLTGLLYQPRMIDDECGAVGGMRIGRGKGSTRIKAAPVPIGLPQISLDLIRGSRRLTAWSMTRPLGSVTWQQLMKTQKTPHHRRCLPARPLACRPLPINCCLSVMSQFLDNN
jgi:hypothetical protein